MVAQCGAVWILRAGTVFGFGAATHRKRHCGRRCAAGHSDARQCCPKTAMVCAHQLCVAGAGPGLRELGWRAERIRDGRLFSICDAGQSHAFGNRQCARRFGKIIGEQGVAGGGDVGAGESRTDTVAGQYAVRVQYWDILARRGWTHRFCWAQRSAWELRIIAETGVLIIHYNARVFYGDNVVPPRASVAGGTSLTIQGLGLQSNTTVGAGNIAAPVLASSATRLLVDAAAADGVYCAT